MDIIKLFFSVLPYLGYILAFLLGCWFYRWMLKRNPMMLQNLVNVVNDTGDYAKAALDKVGNVLTSTPTSTDKPKE